VNPTETAATVDCYRCGKTIPEAEARPYWHRSRATKGEWERQEFCADCAKHCSEPEYTPELDF